MQLRTKWDFGPETSHRAIIAVDIEVPTYPAECPCSKCTMARAVAKFGMQILGAAEMPEDHDENPNRQLSERDQQLIDDLLGIHGVVSLMANDYRIVIERGPVFEWQEITPRVENILANYAGLEPPTPKKQPWHQSLRKLITR